MTENTKEWIKSMVIAVAAALIIIQFIMPTSVYGVSMEPSLEHKDILLVNRQAYSGSDSPERGDIIVFESDYLDEDGNNKKLVKRVIGIPGDTVEVTQGKVYINGKESNEDYTLDGTTNGEVKAITVPDETVFCMGDNRLHSTDSRYSEVGCIEYEKIAGKVFFRLYPFNKIGIVRSIH